MSIDGQMKDVERLIVQAGRKSDSRVVDRIVANYGRFEAARTDRGISNGHGRGDLD